MKFGACINYEKALNSYPVETQFVEIAAWDFVNIEKEKLDRLKKAVEDGSFTTYSSNGLFPRDLRLTGDVDWNAVREYCNKTFYRMAELKVSVLVFGSGKAKHVPDGFPREKAWEQLYELADLMADIAKPLGQTVVVEPLRYEEVNIVNTFSEGAEYCRRVNRDNFKLLVDFYHFDANGEDFSTIVENKDLLYHTHIATPVNRTRPTTAAEWEFFEDCIKKLKSIGYDKALSFEGGAHETEQFNEMLSRMKKIYASLG
ncbi:MAG: sugar phosphate isomerase/epimerase [Ruminococcaceae bacterium]|nr:sugar phosphate isomerase/epimerase [Oscillospiraceae bacterium]